MVKFYGRFGGKITQEYGNSDSIYIPVDPRDYRGVIVDFNDKGDWKRRQRRILDVITTFLIQVGRIKADDSLPWGKVMEMVIDEPEHLVKKNLTFSKILPGFEYWTREGKISKIIIHKPDNPEHFGDLHRWMAFIAYDGFHDNWKMCDVVSLLDDDRYLVAWYALWRKWPLHYEVWEWAGRYKEVRNALKGPNYCDYFKGLYEEEINQGKLVLKESNFMLEWQLFHHCGWDKIEFYPDDPSTVVSRKYEKKEGEYLENLAQITEEWKKVRES